MDDRVRRSADQEFQKQRPQKELDRRGRVTAQDGKAGVGQDIDPAPLENLQSVIHDLRVHQVELEQQNEELRATYAQLEQARDDYQRLYDEAPVGYVLLDASAVIRRYNRTFARMIAADAADVADATDVAQAANRPLTAFMVPEDREPFLGRYRAFFRQPEGKSIEVRLTGTGAHAGNGGRQPLTVRLTGRAEQQRGRQDDGQPIAVGSDVPHERLLVIVYDISEQKVATARADTLLREKELLLREVHHRVRNNLNTVTGMLSLQIAEVDGRAEAAALEQARSRVETMLMVYDLLQSNESSAAIDLQRYLAQLLEKLETIHALSGNVAIAHNLAAVEVSSSLAINVGIIVNELVTNAFKHAFSDAGSGVIQVTLRRTGSDRVLLSVADNGRGLPEDFDLTAATGFGLSVVQGLCDQLEGSVQLQPANPGVSIDITIPVADD